MIKFSMIMIVSVATFSFGQVDGKSGVSPEFQLNDNIAPFRNGVSAYTVLRRMDLSDQKLSFLHSIEVFDTEESVGKDKNGAIRNYQNHKAVYAPDNLTVDDAISEEKALEFIGEIFRAYGKDLQEFDFTLRFYDNFNLKPKDLTGAQWELRIGYEYLGFPCLMKGVRLTVSAYDGRVISFSEFSVEKPNGTEVKFEESSCRKTAATYKQMYFEDFKERKEARLVIVPRELLKNLDDQDASKNGTALCWEFKYENPENDEETKSIYINAGSGILVGQT